MNTVVFSAMHLFVIILNLAVVILCVYLAFSFLRGKLHNRMNRLVENDEANCELSLGALLKKQRCKKNMTQEYVAEQLGVSRQAVSKWESEIAAPNTSNLIALANLYDVPVELILERVKHKEDKA